MKGKPIDHFSPDWATASRPRFLRSYSVFPVNVSLWKTLLYTAQGEREEGETWSRCPFYWIKFNHRNIYFVMKDAIQEN